MKTKNGVLLQSNGNKFSQKAYLCTNGVRHHVLCVDVLSDYCIDWPSDIVRVPDAVLNVFRIGGWLPRLFPPGFSVDAIETSSIMREYLASWLRGFGLEIGAGASPFPIPISCHVMHGDRVSYPRLISDIYPGQDRHDLVIPDIIVDFSTLEDIPDNSLDFIVGCHVIEHVFDPIGAIVNAHRSLRTGGKLVLVVPDPERTFDRDRPLTTLDHLALDHDSPDSQRDYEHYEEFYKLSFKTANQDLRARVDQEFERRGDIHAHVWSYDSFMSFINFVDEKYLLNARWSQIWSHPSLFDKKNDIEFYFVLTK